MRTPGLIFLGFCSGIVAAAEVTTLTSPDGTNSIVLSLGDDGAPFYQVSRRGKPVIERSPLGLDTVDQKLGAGLELVSAGEVEERRERYDLQAGVKLQVDEPHRRQRVILKNATGGSLAIDLDAGDQGIGFRYHLAGEGEATIEREFSGFRPAADAKGWLQPYNKSDSSSPAYEEYFFAVKPGDPPPDSRGGKTRGWYFPALFQTSGGWTLITESGMGSCGMHLAADSQDGTYRVEFPFEDERTRGVPPREGGTRPRHALPWSLPWRVIALADEAAGLATGTLVTDLAEPAKLGDVSWIKPGRASWSWWAYPERQSPEERTQRYAQYLSAAKDRGWEYSLLDAGWWQADMERLQALSKQLDVKLLVWSHANDFYDPERRRRKLDELAGLGFAGVKLDFWCSDRQETLDAMEATLREAAERKLMVNFHGCTLPRGWQRTYPNFMTAEAVLGEESYMFDDRYPDKAAELDTVLPFTRNVAGPMDFTPLGLSEKRYRRKNTAAHEFAAGLVFTSGIVHYADKPEVYEAFPAGAKAVLTDAPARWDETRCLAGEPGWLVVFARRAGDSWFIAGLNGRAEPQEVQLDLTPFASFAKRRLLIREGEDAGMELREEPVGEGAGWNHTMPARGGFVLRLDR